MAIPLKAILAPVYKKVGAIGIQGVVALYFLYRYTRGFVDQKFAERLCSEDLQAQWVVDLPFVWVTALTPAVVWILAEWSRREAKATIRPSGRVAVHLASAAIPPMAAVFVARSHGQPHICGTDIWSPIGGPGTWLAVYTGLCVLASVGVLWSAFGKRSVLPVADSSRFAQ